MEDEFVTINQAVELTGKSKSTLRRLVRELRKKGEQSDTLLKVPTQNDQFYYKLSKMELLKHYPEKPKANQGVTHNEQADTAQDTPQPPIQSGSQPPIQNQDQHTQQVVEGYSKSVDILNKQLERMDGELKRKDQFIMEVLQRQKETHILLKNLQERLLLLEGSNDVESIVPSAPERKKNDDPINEAVVEEAEDQEPMKKKWWQ